jgi:hypothetical protein
MIPSLDGWKPTVIRAKTLRLPAFLMPAICVVMLALLSLPAVGWQSEEESASAQQQQGYPVIVDGYEVFRVRQNLGAATAEQRAQRISAALEDLAMAQDFNPQDIKVNEEGGVATVRYGDQLIVTINDAEAHGSGLPRKALGYQYAKLIRYFTLCATATARRFQISTCRRTTAPPVFVWRRQMGPAKKPSNRVFPLQENEVALP